MVNGDSFPNGFRRAAGRIAQLGRSLHSSRFILLGLLILLGSAASLAPDLVRSLPGLRPAAGSDPADVDQLLAALPQKMAVKSREFLSASPGGSQNVPSPDAVEAPAAGRAGEGPLPAALGPEPELPPAPVVPEVPVRLVIPAIELDAEIVPAKTEIVKVGGKEYQHWLAPGRYAVGWHDSSALLGVPGNTVLNGHHNVYGKVFARLVDLEPGDLIYVYGPENRYEYVVANKMILPEKYQQLDVRMDNARWILPSDDERLTLVTCWPEESNTHRLIIVARPSGEGG